MKVSALTSESKHFGLEGRDVSGWVIFGSEIALMSSTFAPLYQKWNLGGEATALKGE